eukprot:TRINITY_DN20907_c0_g1_i1.p1 TRINITY_DN20907_c0_g1~~TRINITY_DN20907_c0_g1_i1.p1  ORF type:complete len:130 (-),score=34.18 TRINITY_DN20907_c0_g1_i1:130-519(-)
MALRFSAGLAPLVLCLASAAATVEDDSCMSVSLLQTRAARQPGEREVLPIDDPVRQPWWLIAGVDQGGPEKDMGGFKVATFSKEQQDEFAVDELGKVEDAGKFNKAMDQLGQPELKVDADTANDDGEKQ